MTARPVPARHLDLALLLLRVAIGAVFIYHGYQKVFTMGFGGITEGFAKFGVPAANMTAPLISILEFAGGIAVFAGFFTRIAAVLLACDMLGAMVFVHFKNGFSMPTGYEFVLALGFVCAAIALSGPGAYSADAALARRRL